MTHSAPMRAPDRTWARCQMLVPGPTRHVGFEVRGRMDASGSQITPGGLLTVEEGAQV